MNVKNTSSTNDDHQQHQTALHTVSELSPLYDQKYLKPSYKNIRLISHRNHVPRLGVDPDTLTISTDWLAWRYCVDAGHHSIHIEGLLAEWPEERGNPNLHYQSSSTWMYVNGEDITLFHGVSLGNQFNKWMAHLSHGYHRLWHALDRACVNYKPKIIEFYDIRADYDYLDESAKKALVDEITEKHQLQLIDYQDRMSPDPNAFHDLPFQMQSGEPKNLKFYLKFLYEIFVEYWFRLRFEFVKPGKRIYMLLNWPALKNLFENLHGNKLNPVILARQFPKSAKFVYDCWQKNILLTRLPTVRLDKNEEERLNQIIDAIINTFSPPNIAFELVQQNFIRDKIIASGQLQNTALEIKSYERLLDRHKISHIVVGDAENKTCRLLLELAFKKNIQGDELLNGMFVTDEYRDARSGNSVHPPYVKRLLSWGEQNEHWLASRNRTMPTVRTGYPALGIVKREFPATQILGGNALILPVSMEGIKALNTNIFSTLVETVKGLENLGYQSIRIKVHSGHPVEAYYRDVADYFTLNCEIYQAGGLAKHIDWADIVVGPIDSGAFVETMATGTPYYPMWMRPSSLRKKYFGPVIPFETVPELIDAVRQKNYPEPREFLEYFCSADSIPNASTRVWEVLEKPVTPS